MEADRKWSDYFREIPALTWLFVIFGLLALAGGFTAMAFIKVEPAAITALVTAVFGVVGTHVGHVSGAQQAPLCQDQVRHQGQSLLVELEG